MSDLVDEVEREIRAERTKRLAIRYGSIAGVLLLLGLAGFGGWQGWRWWENRAAEQVATRFLATAQQMEAEGADLAAATRAFEAIAADSPAGYRALALLRAAALQAERGEVEAALASYQRIAEDRAVDGLYRDLARLMWGLHALDHAEPDAVIARIEPLAAPGAPWQASAREVLALAQMRAGRTAEARAHLRALAAEPTTPQALRERAGRLLQGLGS